jgi:hypothetical protein
MASVESSLGKEKSMKSSLKSAAVFAATLAAAVQLSGCIVSGDDGRSGPLPTGTLTVHWTIDGQRSSLDCSDFGVDRLELIIYDETGAEVDEVQPYCESFAVSVDLLEGSYFADVTLVDSADRSASLTKTLDALDIIEGTDLDVAVDFPVDSFL